MKNEVSDKAIHIRRCHLCDNVSETKEDSVLQCSHCKKHLAPFYYFDERFTPVFADVNLRPHKLESECLPIYGLSVYWET